MPILFFVLQFVEHHLGEMYKENEHQYDPLHPIECLQTHLKKVVLKLYSAYEHQADFARFFVLNAQVANKIEFDGCGRQYSKESVPAHYQLLQVENRASRDAKFEFRMNHFLIDHIVDRHIHNLAVADPFRRPDT